MIGTGYGERQLKIVSANIDDLRNKTMRKELDIRMGNMKAGLVCLQETHETTSTDQETENYRYISTAALPITGKTDEKGIGGVAILINKKWCDNIMEINRYSHRSMEVEIRTNVNTKTIHLINTHMHLTCATDVMKGTHTGMK